VTRNTFGNVTQEVRGSWRKLQNEKRHDFYTLLKEYYYGDQIEDEIGSVCGTYGEEDKSMQGFDGET